MPNEAPHSSWRNLSPVDARPTSDEAPVGQLLLMPGIVQTRLCSFLSARTVPHTAADAVQTKSRAPEDTDKYGSPSGSQHDLLEPAANGLTPDSSSAMVMHYCILNALKRLRITDSTTPLASRTLAARKEVHP